MGAVKKIVINNQEYDLPEGITPVGDDGLYLVNWNLIELAKEITEIAPAKAEKEFRFFNPRHLGQYEVDQDSENVEVFLGHGFSKVEMRELLADIKQNGQKYELQGYFIITEEGQVKARVHDGERRYLCIERMRDDGMSVYSQHHKKFMPAKEVYSQVLCRIECMTEEEAFMRACAISETNVKWGDGANARLVKALYARGFKDEEICKLLNKSKPWLAETCSLNELDDYCFNFLLANNMNRKVALDLAKVKDIAVRQAWLKDAWKEALVNYAQLQAKNERLLEKAEAGEELAQAEVEEAKVKGDSTEDIADLETAAADAGEKTKKRKQIKAASARPMVKSKHLRKASGFLNALRPPKIKKKLEAVEDMIQKNDTSIVSLEKLEVLKVAYQCILDGEEDIGNVLKRLAG